MNSSPENPRKGSVSLNNYQFDFELGSNFSKSSSARSLKDQKQQPHQNAPYSCSSSSNQSKPSSSTWAPSKPSWTHESAPTSAARSGLSNPTSMVGDIFGKSWGSSAPSTSHAGIVDKNANLFGDLVVPALGQGKNSNVPLKDAATTRNSFLMGNLSDSLPKTRNPVKTSTWGSAENFGNFNSANSGNKREAFWGNSMNSGVPINSKKDPFESLMGFGVKPSQPINASPSKNNNINCGDYSFGAFRNAPKTNTSGFCFCPSVSNYSNPSNSSSYQKMENFGASTQSSVSHNLPPQSQGIDPLDVLFSSSLSGTAPKPAAHVGGTEPVPEVDDWGVGEEYARSDLGGTIELEGLPLPPVGVTASVAKGTGLDSYKQGQFADAIKWLSWAVVLMGKTGENAANVEVLSCRASCYKEVGEYKKAIADCTKVLENDSENVSVLLQRALLYESSEKYKLGAEDLRAVLKIDPGNRLAKGTIHRLTKLAD